MTSIKSAIKRIFGKEILITVVSGLPRSGTSMMMSALKAGGMPLLVDGIREADGNNPRGYYEYEPVKNLPKGSVDWLDAARGKAVKIISALLNYLPKGYQYRIIFMERDIEEILASQKRMLVRSGVIEEKPASDEYLQKSYQAHLKQVKSYLAENDWLDVMYVNYNQVLQDPEGEFKWVAKFLERTVDPSAMSRVVDPDLYRERH
jgi:hypothetical protein